MFCILHLGNMKRLSNRLDHFQTLTPALAPFLFTAILRLQLDPSIPAPSPGRTQLRPPSIRRCRRHQSWRRFLLHHFSLLILLIRRRQRRQSSSSSAAAAASSTTLGSQPGWTQVEGQYRLTSQLAPLSESQPSVVK